jgi:hypothetical protein
MKSNVYFWALFATSLLGSLGSNGQNSGSGGSHCSEKKWNPVKYKETNGVIYPIDDGSKYEYIFLRCDGTYESAENEGRTILKGKWQWDLNKSEITTILVKKVKGYPERVVTKVNSWSEEELVISKSDGGNEQVLIYFTK